MAKTILHIGHGKTGSSALQSFLALNRNLLAEFGIDYAWHASFERARDGAITRGNLESFYEAPADHPGTRLFSSERFCRDILRRPAFLEKLAEIGGCCQIFCYTRDLFDHFGSAYGQMIKRGRGTETMAHFAERYNIYRVLAGVLDVIENTGIEFVLKNYSRLDGPIEADFANGILGDDAGRFLARAQKVEGAVNRSLTRAELVLQRLFNEYAAFPTARFVSDALCNGLPDVAAERPELDARTCAVLIERNRAAIDRINRLLPEGQKISLALPVGNAEPGAAALTFSEPQLRVLVQSISEEIARARAAGGRGKAGARER